MPSFKYGLCPVLYFQLQQEGNLWPKWQHEPLNTRARSLHEKAIKTQRIWKWKLELKVIEFSVTSESLSQKAMKLAEINLLIGRFFKMQLIILKSRPENNGENMQIHRRTKHFNYFLDGHIALLINRLVWWGLQ